MGVPVLIVGKSLINAVIEVLVVGEYNVATNIVELEHISLDIRPSVILGHLTKPSGVTSVEARPPGVSFESTSIQDGPS